MSISYDDNHYTTSTFAFFVNLKDWILLYFLGETSHGLEPEQLKNHEQLIMYTCLLQSVHPYMQGHL